MKKTNSISNFRDLGGLIGRDGLRVKKNVLFRSGNLNRPTEVLDEYLRPFGISLVFDLRSADETVDRPYVLPPGISYRHRPVLASLGYNKKEKDPPTESRKDIVNVLGGRSPASGKSALAGDFMSRMYTEMGDKPRVFGDIMKEMIENVGKPVLFHCSAGKDRTGVLATMLLLGLGVSAEDIKEHYLLSNEYRREAIERELEKLAAQATDSELLETMRNMFVVKEEYLDAVLSRVAEYPVFEDYAQEMLGLSADNLRTLQNLYLR